MTEEFSSDPQPRRPQEGEPSPPPSPALASSSPPATTDWMDRYFELLDQHGPQSPFVKRFEEEHSGEEDAAELFAAVKDLGERGRTAKQRKWSARALLAGALVLVASLAFLGVQRSLQLTAKEKEQENAVAAKQELERKFAQAREENQKLSRNLEPLQTALDQEKGARQRLAGELNDAKSAVQHLKDRQREEQEARQKTAQELEATKTEAKAAKEKSASLQTENSRLTEEKEKVAQELEKSRNECKVSEQLVKELKQKLLRENEKLVSTIVYYSFVRTNHFPEQEDLSRALVPDSHDEGAGLHYALALWYDIRREDKKYLDELGEVPEQDPWYPLAQAERKAVRSGSVDPFLFYFTDLERRIASSPRWDSLRLPLLLTQRTVAIQTVSRLQNKNKQTASQLTKWVASDEQPQRAAAVTLLGEIGPEARPAVPELVQVLERERDNGMLRWQAAHTLGQIGPAAQPAVEVLQTTTKEDKVESVRAEAARALLLIIPPSGQRP
jgi:hypothetical protein